MRKSNKPVWNQKKKGSIDYYEKRGKGKNSDGKKKLLRKGGGADRTKENNRVGPAIPWVCKRGYRGTGEGGEDKVCKAVLVERGKNGDGKRKN